MQVMPREIGDRRAQGGDLGQRQVHEDHAALDHVHAEVSVNAGQDEAGHEGRQEDFQDRHFLFSMVPTKRPKS